MANLGHYTDRNPDIRAAGISTLTNPEDNFGAKDCLVSLDIGEQAEHLILAHCRQQKPKSYARTPKHPKSNMDDHFGENLQKGPFENIQEKSRENYFIRRPVLSQAMETYSIPENVNNWSQTFGISSIPEDSVYSVIMPPKTVEQVNREYAEYHNQHIISHNHYFPSEQINRRYTDSFNRFDTFGVPTNTDPSGIKVKNCLNESEEHLKIIKKPKKDLDNRTKAPLGKKFLWYPYKFPKNMTFGKMSQPEFGVQSLMEYTSPSSRTAKMTAAISHINHLRNILQHRDDFNMNQLITALDKKDTEGTRQLPLAQIIQIMRKMNIPGNFEKLRIAASHFGLFVDENCCEERVKYEGLCDILSVLKPLPTIGSISPEPETVYNKFTTYRLLCADLAKKPEEGLVSHIPHAHISPIKEDINNTHVKDIIRPDPPMLCGIWPSDFRKARGKVEMERIFQGFVSEDDFARIWQALMEKQPDAKDMASVQDFRAEMIRIEDEKKAEA
ncbi:uncharacterized protein LOC110181277 [Drosophila serrata]|uniref:uncharacterized protein LOC110181277 n=1 Tax=Drosophila serrata TaxID=7274 RepID=UPI000A1D3A29|nr:uncharacterized protein LOC110181277 [Drosophila serrata]